MNTNEELENKVARLEKTVNVLLDALEASQEGLDLDEVREALNPSPTLSESQQEARDETLLRSYYGSVRYDRDFAGLSAGEKALEAWKVFG